ncbi:hypothetical protein D3C81_1950850 [compost metagenome]
MALKLLILPANWAISVGAVMKSTMGMVTMRNFWYPEAPSTSAASYISFGILVNTPRMSSMDTGMPTHILTTITVTLAQNGSVSQGRPPSPI